MFQPLQMLRNMFHIIHRCNFKPRSRFCSNVKSDSVVAFNKSIPFSKEEHDEFMSIYPEIVEDITCIEPYNKLPIFTSSMKRMLDYNVTVGTNSSGLVTVYAYKMTAKPENQTPENIRLAIIMGWCMRLYEASQVIIDDLLDNSLQRYQKPSWHALPHIGNSAALHGLFITNSIYYLLHKYFVNHPQFKNIQGIFSNSHLHSNIAHCLDVLPYHESNMTQEYLDIFYFGKAAFSTVYTFMILGMYFADIPDPNLYGKIQEITRSIGVLWQIQNDYLDCFDNPKKRHPGTDIKGSRITWLSVTAFNRCNPIQKKLFRNNFGNGSEDAVNKIINLYKELDIPRVFEETNVRLENEIINNIKKLPNDVIPHELFYRILSNIRLQLSTTF